MHLEVYIVYKKLGKDRYTKNVSTSHHQLIFKTEHNHFYYTDLQVDGGSSISNSFSGTGKVFGKVKLRYGAYTFFDGPIYYKPVGTTKKTKKEIEEFVEDHSSQGTIYDLWSNNCQTYVKSVIEEFLELDYPRHSDEVKEAFDKDELSLESDSDADSRPSSSYNRNEPSSTLGGCTTINVGRPSSSYSRNEPSSALGGCTNINDGRFDYSKLKWEDGGCFGKGGPRF